MKALIETDVLIDAIFRTEPYHSDADRILDLVKTRKIEGYLSIKTLIEIFRICKKADGNKNPKSIVEKLFFTFNIIDITEEDSTNSLMSDIEDYGAGILVSSSLRNGVNAVITKNREDFLESDMLIIHPADIDEYLGREVEVKSLIIG
jgi:predicted nucleic acid-binding protein